MLARSSSTLQRSFRGLLICSLITLRRRHLHKAHKNHQRHSTTRHFKPESILITLLVALIRCLDDDNVREAQQYCDAELEQDVRQRTGEALLLGWHVRGEEDGGGGEDDVDGDGGADHGGKYPAPVGWVLGHDGKEDRVYNDCEGRDEPNEGSARITL